jgi:hypothetical protein
VSVASASEGRRGQKTTEAAEASREARAKSEMREMTAWRWRLSESV